MRNLAKHNRDPQQYCIRCDYRYRAIDESCLECGFAPVDDIDDGQAQADAEDAYRLMGGKEQY